MYSTNISVLTYFSLYKALPNCPLTVSKVSVVRLIKLSVNREFTINREGEGRIRDSTRGLKAAGISQILSHNLFLL